MIWLGVLDPSELVLNLSLHVILIGGSDILARRRPHKESCYY
jgi:hypothetical protein